MMSSFVPWQTLTSLSSTINYPAIESLYGPINENRGIPEGFHPFQFILNSHYGRFDRRMAIGRMDAGSYFTNPLQHQGDTHGSLKLSIGSEKCCVNRA